VYHFKDVLKQSEFNFISFGALYAGSLTGIIFNNEMNDFSLPDTENLFKLPPSPANFIRPGKKPMSSMAPVIIVDKNDNVRLVLGASGGTKILTAVAQVALNNLYLGLNIKEAIDKHRLHHQLSPNFVEIENGFDFELQDSLRSKGHNISCFSFGGSVIQGIERKEDMQLWANSDARKGGETDGF
jgi:gamma-glutamyltranspeptidase / glutathione hydrolase / leukotriene-C4 hydrolase